MLLVVCYSTSFTITIYKLVSAILVSLPNPNAVAAVNGVVVAAFSGILVTAFSSILFNFFYRNYSSNYIIEPYRKYYGRFY